MELTLKRVLGWFVAFVLWILGSYFQDSVKPFLNGFFGSKNFDMYNMAILFVLVLFLIVTFFYWTLKDLSTRVKRNNSALIEYIDLWREDIDEVENYKQDYLEEAILDILENMKNNNLLIGEVKNIKSDFIKGKLSQHIGKHNEKRLSDLEIIKNKIINYEPNRD